MPRTLACPHCKGIIELSPSLSGQQVECPHCKGKLLAPSFRSVPIAKAAAPPVRQRQVTALPQGAATPSRAGNIRSSTAAYYARRRQQNSAVLITLGVFAVLLVIGSAVALVQLMTETLQERALPAAFNPNDVAETARWAAHVTKPLNSVPRNSNELVRNDEIRKRLDAAKQSVSDLIGQSVSWSMGCYVSEDHVTILANQFGQYGSSYYGHNPIALMVLDYRPTQTALGRSRRPGDGIDPLYWFFSLEIPKQVPLEEAKTLGETVTVNGEIKEIEIERFRDRELEDYEQNVEDEWYLLYVYLTNVELVAED